MHRLWIVFLIILITTDSYAHFMGNFMDFSPNHANQIYTDTTLFSEPNGVLGASDFTVQRALQTLNASGSTVTSILNCQTSDDFCFEFASQVLILWVRGSQQAQWPIEFIANRVLLESGDLILLEDGTSKILLE